MKRIALAIGAGIVATGAVVASAASLGTLTVNTLGTDTAAIGTCNDDEIIITWNTTPATYVAGNISNATYTTTTGTATAPLACNGAQIQVTVAETAGPGASLASATGTISGGTAALNFGGGFDSKLATQTTVTVYNDTAP